MNTVNTSLIKTPYTQETWTEDERKEIGLCINSPEYFAKTYCYTQHTRRGKIKLALFDYQKELINVYHKYRYSISLLPRQSGKALDIETDILTPKGFVKMKNLSVGDTIYGQNGEKTNITFITEVMHNRTCYEVTFDNNDSIIADAEHLWSVIANDKKNQTVTTEDLITLLQNKDNPYVKLQKTVIFDKQNVQTDPYLFGLRLSSNSKHDDAQNANTSNNAKIEISTTDKHIPEEYILNDIKTRIELLRGLLKGSGIVNKKTGECIFYQKNDKLVKQVKFLISSLGIKSQTKKHIHTDGIRYHSVGFTIDYHNTFELKKIDTKNNKLFFNSIREVKSRPVRCLKVDNDDSLFLAGNSLIPTHNTTCAGAYLLWYAMFIPDSTILVAAHQFSGAQEIMHRIRYMYEFCPDFIRAGATSYNKGSIGFDNGSRIIAQATTEKTGRGMSLSLVYLDEFSFVLPRIATEFWASISPTLSTGGKCIITSTPTSDEGQFAEIWKQANKNIDEFGNETDVGINGFKAFRAYWNQHPEKDEEWAAKERAKVGDELFRREYECCVGSTSIKISDGHTIKDEEIGTLFNTIDNFSNSHTTKNKKSFKDDNQIFKSNEKKLKVLTPKGYQDFKGVAYMGMRPIYRMDFDNKKFIECTDNHGIYDDKLEKRIAGSYKPNDSVMTIDGLLNVTSAKYVDRFEPVYDLIGVSGGNKFYANDILISNCEFVSFDETLINNLFLTDMDTGIDPIRRSGQVRWYEKIQDGDTFIVALDPSLGTGGDPSAIEIFAMPGMRQIGEWQHNKTLIQTQIKVLRSILEEIEENAPNSEIYYSVENNTIGEAALVSINEMGEDNIPGIFLSEKKSRSRGRPRSTALRKGFNTTNTSKLTACAKFKRWVEEGYIKIHSKNLIREIKHFIAVGNTYKAKSGETDDLVMATLLITRMAMQVSKYDEDVFQDIKDSFDDEDYRPPMPFGMLVT